VKVVISQDRIPIYLKLVNMGLFELFHTP